MRLSKNNIDHICMHEKNDIPYGYFVAMKSNCVSDSREYINHKENHSVAEYYPLEWLPKTVQKFIDERIEHCVLLDQCEICGDVYTTYIIK